MATERQIEDFFNAFTSDRDLVGWNTADDINRLSIEAVHGLDAVVRATPAFGELRLAGEAVEGHSAKLADVGHLATRFQRLVTSIGAALRGTRSAMGKVPAAIQSLTTLELTAEPAPGSIVLQLGPRIRPSEELRPNGELFDLDETPLIDDVMAELAEILAQLVATGPDADASGLIQHIQELGPRTAGSLRDFAWEVSESRFDVDIGWKVPGAPDIAARLGKSEALLLQQLVKSRHLDAVDVWLHGTLHTISDEAFRLWTMDSVEYGRIRLGTGDLSESSRTQFRPSEQVKVRALMTLSKKAGGDLGRDFSAVSIDKWDGGIPESEVNPMAYKNADELDDDALNS